MTPSVTNTNPHSNLSCIRKARHQLQQQLAAMRSSYLEEVLGCELNPR